MRNWISLAGMAIGAAVLLACASTTEVATAPQPTLRKDIHLEGPNAHRFVKDSNFVEAYRILVQGTRTPRGGCSFFMQSVPGYKVAAQVESDMSTCQSVVAYGNLRMEAKSSAN